MTSNAHHNLHETPPATAEGLATAKQAAALHASKTHIHPGLKTIGIGSGSTIPYIIPHIPKHVVCIPSSFQARELIIDNGLTLGSLEQYHQVDITIDGADEVDASLSAIKGGGGAHLEEKILASASREFIVIGDWTKASEQLGTRWRKGVPVEVCAVARKVVERKVTELGGKPVLRMAKEKAGPVITDHGNIILDCDFGPIQDPKALEQNLLYIPGVIEVGIFNNLVHKAYFGHPGGQVTTRDTPHKAN